MKKKNKRKKKTEKRKRKTKTKEKKENTKKNNEIKTRTKMGRPINAALQGARRVRAIYSIWGLGHGPERPFLV